MTSDGNEYNALDDNNNKQEFMDRVKQVYEDDNYLSDWLSTPEGREIYDKAADALRPFTQKLRDNFEEQLPGLLDQKGMTVDERAEAMDLARGLVDKVERALISIPFIGVEVALAKAAEVPTDLSKDQIGEIQKRLHAMSISEAGEARHLVALASTSDTVGIFLRGHVLLENYLDRCINAYLVEPLNLYKHLEIFFSQKIRLATSLGLISTAEQRLLKKLNRIRNDLAHLPENKNQPPYRLTVGEQKSIWNDFTELPAFKAKSWPQFDAVNGLSLKTMLIAFIMELQRRESIIESRRLGPIADEILALPVQRTLMATFASKVAKTLPKLEGQFENDPPAAIKKGRRRKR